MPRKRVKSSSNLIPKFWKIGLAVLIPLIILDVYLLIDSQFFKVKDVEINLDKASCVNESDVRTQSGLLGENILYLNEINTIRKIKNKYLCVKSVQLQRSLPNKVTLNISGRIPVALLSLHHFQDSSSSASLILEELFAAPSSSEATESFIVDEEGIVFAKYTDSNLPKIYYSGEKLNLGEKLGEGIIKSSLQILEKIKSFGVEVKEAKIYSKILSISGNIQIIFDLEKNYEYQLASLQLILTEAKMINREMEMIDLRFDKPVVKYYPKKK